MPKGQVKPILQEQIDDAKERIEALEKEVFVEDVFRECPTCSHSDRLPRRKAISFERLQMNFSGHGRVNTFYTTDYGYEAHKSLILKWKAEVDSWRKIHSHLKTNA